jgi:putative ABC transport system permease protein
MSIRDLVGLVWLNLNRMRGRVTLTAMGVVIGTASIVVLVALAAGLQESTVTALSNFGSLTQITVRGSAGARFGPGPGGGGGGVSSDIKYLTPSVLEEFAEMEQVAAVTPYEQLTGSNSLTMGRLDCRASIVGIEPEAMDALGLTVAEGTNTLGGNNVIAGATASEECFDPQRPDEEPDEEQLEMLDRTLFLEQTRTNDDGDEISRTVRLKVTGVLEEIGSNDDSNIYMSLDDVEDLITWAQGESTDRNTEGYSQARVVVTDSSVATEVEETISDEGFSAMSASSALESVNQTFAIIQAMFGGIGAIAVFVAALGIANTMIMTVLERTREIGLMKAVGATNGNVMSVFLAEAAAIGLLGGVGGVVAGIALAKLIGLIAASYVGTQAAEAGSTSTVSSLAVIPLWLPIFSIGFALLIGLGSGIYPAMRAVQLDPVTALKYE